jgi:hypothetical protein
MPGFPMPIGEFQSRIREQEWLEGKGAGSTRIRLKVIASGDEIDKAHQLLGQVENLREELRFFLLQKFKFEDVL